VSTDEKLDAPPGLHRRVWIGIVVLLCVIAPSSVRAVYAVDACTGDCDANGAVTIDEIIIGVTIALEDAPLARCPVFDQDGSGTVEINELIAGISNALNGCVTLPTPTPAPGAVARAVAGRAAIVADAMTVVPNVVGGILNGILFMPTPAPAAPRACAAGGSAKQMGSFPNYALTLTGCQVVTADGTVTLDGTATLNVNSFATHLTATFQNSTGLEVRRATANMVGTITSSLTGKCLFLTVTFGVSSGTLSIKRPAGPDVDVTFQNTTLTLNNITFNAGCLPVKYRLTIDGLAGLLASEAAPSPLDFTGVTIDGDSSATPGMFELNGSISSPCFGGAIHVTSATPLTIASNEFCPRAGTLRVNVAADASRITYRSDTSVEIDDDDNGTIDQTAPSCLAPPLLMCLG